MSVLPLLLLLLQVIPITQQGVAESSIVRTGVCREGNNVLQPGYVRSRTLILLMGLTRLSQIITALVDPSNSQNRRDGVALH